MSGLFLTKSEDIDHAGTTSGGGGGKTTKIKLWMCRPLL